MALYYLREDIMNWLTEFKTFALKGNVIDLAVAVIIGGAFSGIVNSIVTDLMMPVVSLLTGGVDFSQHFIRLGRLPEHFRGNPNSLQDVQSAGASVLAYGNFMTVVINFIILAFIIFMMIKMLNRLQRSLIKEEAPPASTPEDISLLREIRDALKSHRKS